MSEKKSYQHRRAGGGGGGAAARRKLYLEAGQRGFFCTCNFREKDCVKEAYNLLNEHADRLLGDTRGAGVEGGAGGDEGDKPQDISELLKQEIDVLRGDSKKNVKERRFQAVETGAANCVFIRTNLPNPEVITDQIFKELLETKVQKTRFLLRIIPISATCKANLLDITNTAGPLFDEHFLKEPSSFAILFNKRYHSKLSRDEVIKELADLVVLKNAENKADLKNPKKAIIVEIIKGICLLSVVTNYYEYKKYNLFEICKDETKKGDATANGGKTQDNDADKEKAPAQTEENQASQITRTDTEQALKKNVAETEQVMEKTEIETEQIPPIKEVDAELIPTNADGQEPGGGGDYKK